MARINIPYRNIYDRGTLEANWHHVKSGEKCNKEGHEKKNTLSDTICDSPVLDQG